MKANAVTDALLERRSVRSYKDLPVPDELIETLNEVALWSPSARNRQPLHIRVVRDRALLDTINAAFKDYVGPDAPAYTRSDVNPFYQNAPALYMLFSENGAALDAGICAANITAAAKGLGLDSVIIGCIGEFMNTAKAAFIKEKLDVPADFRFEISVAVGFGDENPPKKDRVPGRIKVIG